MKKVFLAISTISLLWIIFAAFISGRAINNIIVLQNKNTSCRQYNFDKGYFTGTPNCTGVRELADQRSGIKFNSFGHSTYEPISGKNKKRIAILGGSNLVGLTMKEHFIEDQIADLWKNYFNAEVEVMNLSVEGYTLTHHAIDLQENIKHYKPDVIFLSSSLDSKMITDAILSNEVIHSDESYYQRLRRGSEIYPTYLLYLMEKSETLKKVVRTIHLNWMHLRFSSQLSDNNSNIDKVEKLVLMPNLKLLNYFKSVCEKNGIKLYILIDGDKLTNRYAQKLSDIGPINRFITSFAKSIEISPERFSGYFQRNGIELIRQSMPKEQQFYIGGTKYFSPVGYVNFFSNVIEKISKAGQ